jgi:Right handed beta helix region
MRNVFRRLGSMTKACGRRRTHLHVEYRDDRTVPSTFSVSSLADSGLGSLRQAILDANARTDNDTITFSVTGAINLAGALPDLSTNIDIQGPGANLLTVRRDTGGDYRVFTVASGATVAISGLTLSNGLGDGGGIANAGTLNVKNAIFSGNSGGEGGGLYNSGTATVTACTFTGNYGDWSGSALYNVGTLTLSNSTLSGNTVADDWGFGVIGSESTLIVTNSTIWGNTGFYGGVWTAWNNEICPF